MRDRTLALLTRAKAARTELSCLSPEKKNEALLAIADALEKNVSAILAANAEDVEAARATLGAVMTDRLLLTKERIVSMAQGVREVAALPDPVGRVLSETTAKNGLQIQKISVPFGVVAVIYESRPNVTSDAAALLLKSGNVCVLKCGKEAFRSAHAVVSAMRGALTSCGLNPDFIHLPDDPTRETATELMTATGYIDLLIPRGGAGLIRSCVENATVPCIETGTGICHVYVDERADVEKALAIVENAKASRPSVCNAEEVLLVHRGIAAEFLPRLKRNLTAGRKSRGLIPVELRLSESAREFISGTPASEKDFDTEFLDYILAVKVVASLGEAIREIGLHSTHHSDAIVTEDKDIAERFLSLVDSAAVYWNASTRFTDGGEFGKGCEIGISTQKLHARGPMGLEEMNTYKYVVRGNGQVR